MDDMTLMNGYDAGNYAAAYGGLELAAALEAARDEAGADWHSQATGASQEYGHAFTLGFLSSLSESELGEEWDAYWEAMAAVGERLAELGVAIEKESEVAL